jgi:hypothetical protein
VEITSSATGHYGRDLTLEWEQRPPHLEVTDAYTLRAITRGYTRATDEALIVKYTANFKLALCAPERATLSTMTIPLPKDPWLFYWHVSKEHHRPLRYFKDRAHTNPCNDNDFASLPHPIYSWYDWWPDRHGPDDDGRPFDCRTILKQGVDFFPHALELRRYSSPSGKFDTLKTHLAAQGAPLQATLLMGVQDHQWKDLALSSLRDELNAQGRLTQRVGAMLSANRSRELALEKLLFFLRDLSNVMTVGTHHAQLQGEYLHLTVNGELRRTARPMTLQVYYGLTDVFGPRPPSHWDIARKAITEDHLVIYIGHSGIGENLKIARIAQELHLDPVELSQQIARGPYQMVAFLSCYSYMYFGLDMMTAGAPAKEFVFTGTGYSRGDRGALAVIDLFDQALDPKTRAIQAGLERYLRSDDFLIFKSHRPTSPATP